MFRKKDFLLIYEYKNRELDNLCLLRAELERRGYSVDIICRFDLYSQLLWLFRPQPKVVGCVAAYSTASLFTQVYRFVGKVNKIINFRWEQIFADMHFEKFTPTGKASEVAHLCWGRKPYEQLLSRGIKHCEIVGALQMDYINEPINKIYYSTDEIKEQFNIPAEKKVLLYISSFAYSTMSSTELSRSEKWFGISLTETRESEKKSFNTTIDYLSKLLKEDPDLYVIYRPHPAEDATVIRNRALSDRFKIISDYSIKQWILTSDYIVTWISTSICEVYFANKKAVILRPFPVSEISEPIIYKNCQSVSTYEQFREALYITQKFPLDSNLIEEYYSSPKETHAYKRTADYFEKILKDKSYSFCDDTNYNVRRFHNLISVIVLLAIVRFNFLSSIMNLKLFRKLHNSYNEYQQYFFNNYASKEEIIMLVTKLKNLIERSEANEHC